MRRDYFDIRDGEELTVDEEGFELSSIQAVQEGAAHTLADMARDAVRRRGAGSWPQMAIEVRDDSGPVMQVKFTFEIDRHKH
jgi:hypothetical protein